MDKFQIRIARTSEAALESGVVSPDDFRMEDGVYVHRPHEQGKIWEAAYTALKMLLRQPATTAVVALVGVPGAGKSTWLSRNRQDGVVYFDATLASPRDRKRFLTTVRTARKDIEARAVFLDTPLDVCKSRNATRTEDRRVPEHVLESMASMLSDNPPKTEEGWDAVVVTDGEES